MTDLQYPIGRFRPPSEFTEALRREWVGEIGAAPAQLRAAVRGLSADQLLTSYRPEGWTVAQVVHHLPDSHVNSYVRCRLALTEDEPTITPYSEPRWAALPDASSADIEPSLLLLEGLHRRWVGLLGTLSVEQWARVYRHPERGPMTIERTAALYAWHGRHHVAHITGLRRRMGW